MIWAQVLSEAEFVCYNAINDTTGMSPFQALMGYNPTISRRIGNDASTERYHTNAAERVEKLANTQETVGESLG